MEAEENRKPEKCKFMETFDDILGWHFLEEGEIEKMTSS
jgi:hypothetical protein